VTVAVDLIMFSSIFLLSFILVIYGSFTMTMGGFQLQNQPKKIPTKKAPLLLGKCTTQLISPMPTIFLRWLKPISTLNFGLKAESCGTDSSLVCDVFTDFFIVYDMCFTLLRNVSF
jgi:hypothetical protein